ncbi:MAG: SRPBCC domain-containing protein [Bacteroidia bacterium]|nr:SRPBCC domain-containing protein [Bacteroidia bacterium]
MEQKTKIHAEEGKQDLWITREFDLPLELLFRAYSEADIIEQWMGTKVLKLENKKHGSYHFETTDPKGNKYNFHGAVHEYTPNKRIVRTFEFEGMPMGIQLELLEFEELGPDTSKVTIHTIFESVEKREQQLKMPFAYGLNMAHNRIQELLNQLK